MESVLLRGGKIWDGSGKPAISADILVAGNRIAEIRPQNPRSPDGTRTISIAGHTVIPGLVDGHAHLPFLHKADIADTGDVPPEEHTLRTTQHARVVLEAGFTSCVSGGSAKPRIDVVIRNEIDAGHIPGPRLLAAGPELTNTGNLGDERRMHIHRESIAMIVDGVDEMSRACRTLIREGVDTIKLNISGNQTTPNSASDRNIMNDEEVGTAARTAHAHGKRVAAHTRAATSIKLALKHDVDILYHCEYADEECLDLLEAARERVFVAPAIGLLHNLLYEAEPWGITYQKAEAAGVAHQFECAQRVFAQLRKRGVRVLVGGDYGFPWTPHGTNARDLGHFVRFFGYSDAQALVAATRTGAAAMMLEGRTGEVAKGYLADLVVVAGEPQNDVRLLESAENIRLVMKDGRIYKNLFSTLH